MPTSEREPTRVLRVTGKRPCETPLTLGRAAYYALRLGEQGLDWKESQRRAELAEGIRDAKDWRLINSDLELIKKAMPRIWGPPLIHAAAVLLDSK